MKKLLLILFLSCGLLQANSQELLMDTEDVLPADFIEPRFGSGGFGEFYDFVKSNFDFSKVKQKGSIITSFAISDKGDLTDIRIVKFDDVAAAGEMIRVLKLSPKWKPAIQAGKPVKTRLKLPFQFN